jgi:RNA polymerase sigma-70 factor, ECF subfamily
VPGRDPFADPEPLIRRVYAYVAYRVGDGADAEDITSATFERALRYRDRFDGRKGDVTAWLIGIARRQIAEHFGAQPVPVGDVPDQVAPGELDADLAAQLDLRATVARLGERDRELIALRYGADLTARQIAEQLGMQTNAVEVALHRSLQTLRELLEQPSSASPSGRGAHELRTAE